MIKSIHTLEKGKLKILGYASGSGSTLWKLLDMQKELEKSLEGSPFEIVGVFSDNPNSAAINTAKKVNIPYVSLDLREYYQKYDKPISDMNLREQFDAEVLKLIAKFNADIILLAGYVWATTDTILDNYLVINVHPADLSKMNGDKRAFGGANGIGDALDAKEKYLCSTAHIATKELDSGPILVISPNIEVDYSLHDNELERKKYYLKLVNNESRMIAARTIFEIAVGNFKMDENRNVYYDDKIRPYGIKINSWNENIPKQMISLKPMFYPKSIAVIGASDKTGIGNAVVKNINSLEFNGNVYSVNKRGVDVLGTKGYKSILDIEEEIDLAIITVPSVGVIDVARECGEKGVKSIICISAGFKEIGEEGIKRENELKEIISKYNMRLLGPNCMGASNTNKSINLNSTILHTIPKKGPIAFVTQSGALSAGILDFAENFNFGFSIIASLGNQGDIVCSDLLPLLYEDKSTEIILLYLESIQEPIRFSRILEKITKKKPVIIIKSGRTDAGAKAASSHTGSLAGNDRVADALIKKSGAIRVETLEDAFHITAALTTLPKLKGTKVGVLTNAGGPGILVADSLNKYGFKIETLKQEFRNELSLHLLKEASTQNPIDIVASAPPKHYSKALSIMKQSNQYDAILVICVPPATIDMAEVAKEIVNEIKEMNIPVLTCFFGPTLGDKARKIMKENNILSYMYPEQLSKVLNMLPLEDDLSKCNNKNIYKDPNSIKKIRDINFIENSKYRIALPYNRYLSSKESTELLKSYNLNIAKDVFIRDYKEIDEYELEYPVVAKIDHKDIIHKSDLGGVILNIKNKEELKNVINDLIYKFPGARGVQVQEQVSEGIELIVGAIYDNNLGHAIMLGLGGILVEIYEDVSFSHVPLLYEDIDIMIDSLKCKQLLYGYRGEKGINIDCLKEIIYTVNNMIINNPEIEELDLNPLIYSREKEKFTIVDSRIKLR